MSNRVTHAANLEANVSFYRYYRSTTLGGTYTLAGTQVHVAGPAAIVFVDTTGGVADHYKVEAVNTDGIPSIATNPFQTESGLSRTRVWDLILDGSGTGLANIPIEVRISDVAFFNGVIVPESIRRTTDARGFWFVDLFPNSILTPATTDYAVVIPRLEPTRRIVVPVALTAKFRDLIVP